MIRYYLLLFILLPTLLRAQITFNQQNTGITSNLLGIHFANGDIGYACSDNGTIIKTQDGGATWTTLNSTTSNALWDIKTIPGSNGQKVIAVGANNTVIKSVDGGATWTTQSIPFQTGSFVFGIHCLDDQKYFACGGDFGTFTGAVLTTTDGGANWTSTPVSTSIFIDKIFMADATNGYIAGTNTTISDGSLHNTTNGTSWSLTKASPTIITNVWATATNNVVAVGLDGQIWRSTDNGANWTTVSANTIDLYGICFQDGKTGFACGGNTSSSILLITLDSGKTWRPNNISANSTLRGVSIAGNHVFVASDVGQIFRGELPPTRVINVDKQLSFDLYPNPTHGYISLNGLPLQFSYTARVTDISGKLLIEQHNVQNGASIDVSGLSNGIYQLQLYSTTGELYKGTKPFEIRQ